MSVRAARWLLFLVLAATVPAPLLIGFDASVPGVRYAILFAATAVVAAREGAQGPVPGILALFGLHAAAYLLLAGLAAGLAGRVLSRLSPAARGAVVLAACGALLLAAIAFDLYRTPFGRAPRSNLWGILS